MTSQVDINSLFSKLLGAGIIRKVEVDSPGPHSTPPDASTIPTDSPAGPFGLVAEPASAENSQDGVPPLDLDNLKITMEPCSPEEAFIPEIKLESDQLKV